MIKLKTTQHAKTTPHQTHPSDPTHTKEKKKKIKGGSITGSGYMGNYRYVSLLAEPIASGKLTLGCPAIATSIVVPHPRWCKLAAQTPLEGKRYAIASPDLSDAKLEKSFGSTSRIPMESSLPGHVRLFTLMLNL